MEFVKVGAVSTFIKHDDSVSIIKMDPGGMLNHIDMELERKLVDGDFIIMV